LVVHAGSWWNPSRTLMVDLRERKEEYGDEEGDA
jgi:hypothetical protein